MDCKKKIWYINITCPSLINKLLMSTAYKKNQQSFRLFHLQCNELITSLYIRTIIYPIYVHLKDKGEKYFLKRKANLRNQTRYILLR